MLTKSRRISERSLANLRPQKPGEPGHNKAGRPKKADCLIGCIKDELEKLSINGTSTHEQLIAQALVSMAAKGNIKAIELCLEYTTVKPKIESAVEVSGGFKVVWDGIIPSHTT
jgi:hypothetical protein